MFAFSFLGESILNDLYRKHPISFPKEMNFSPFSRAFKSGHCTMARKSMQAFFFSFFPHCNSFFFFPSFTHTHKHTPTPTQAGLTPTHTWCNLADSASRVSHQRECTPGLNHLPAGCVSWARLAGSYRLINSVPWEHRTSVCGGGEVCDIQPGLLTHPASSGSHVSPPSPSSSWPHTLTPSARWPPPIDSQSGKIKKQRFENVQQECKSHHSCNK